jgi:large subunit ribosomal protein L15
LGFEGGQMPLVRRVPKRGFTNIFRREFEIVNVAALADLKGDVTPEILVEKGWARGGRPIKILGDGELSKKLKVHAHKFSKSARAKIEAAGGTCEVIDS